MYEEPGGGMNMLEICNLTKKYDKEKGIFDLSYSFEEGKSMLLWDLMGLERQHSYR